LLERVHAAQTEEATMGELSPWHLLIVAAVFLLLFGANKLPNMARSVGQSMRIFKAETRALSGEKEPEQLPRTTGSSATSFQDQSHHTAAAPAQPVPPSAVPPPSAQPPST
jgi:sec-independent protein translocase protein TatA